MQYGLFMKQLVLGFLCAAVMSTVNKYLSRTLVDIEVGTFLSLAIVWGTRVWRYEGLLANKSYPEMP